MNYLEINEKKYPVRFAYKAIRGIMSELNLTFKDFENETKVVSLMNDTHIFLYYGMKSGFKADDREFKLTLEDVEDLVDSVNDFTGLSTKVFEMFSSSMIQEEKKKKPVRKQADKN
jgi:hypothetical protein